MAAAIPAAVQAQPPGPSNGDGEVYFEPSIYFPGLDSMPGAQSDITTQRIKILMTPTTLGEYIVALYTFFTGATALVALFMVTYGGLQWLLAGGNQGSITKAKETIGGALAGMVIALLSYALLATISRGLVEFKSLDTRLEAPAGQTDTETPGGTRPFVPPTALPLKANFEDLYGSIFAEASSDFGVDCTLLKAHALAESGGRPAEVSGAGACGMLQVMPETANDLIARYPAEAPRPGPMSVSCGDLQEPRFGIRMGAAYIAQLRDGSTFPTNYGYCTARQSTLKPQFSWGEEDKIAAYNGGPGANCLSVTCPGQTYWECTQNSGYQQTRNYVRAVRTYYQMLIEQLRFCE